MRRLGTTLVDAKYGRLWLDSDKVPESADSDVDGAIDEPVFVLRAQDDLAVATIQRYYNMARQIEAAEVRPSPEWFTAVETVIGTFMQYRNENPDKIKVPD